MSDSSEMKNQNKVIYFNLQSDLCNIFLGLHSVSCLQLLLLAHDFYPIQNGFQVKILVSFVLSVSDFIIS